MALRYPDSKRAWRVSSVSRCCRQIGQLRGLLLDQTLDVDQPRCRSGFSLLGQYKRLPSLALTCAYCNAPL